ncbi:MAG: 16S rRNA (guanine(527)-N(7))-methyltransferase RsmG [Nitrospinota bacterium]|nr:16S rRNA (guanine(527)-N(7))-methyltransferase RsmG [Nitrospinota bacterium]
MSVLTPEQITGVLNHPKLDLSSYHWDDKVLQSFSDYCSLLVKWNSRINLTSEKQALPILRKHVFDSLHYLRWISPSHRVLDIGSGGGFPGIPVKILEPQIELSLLDSQRKRCNFLRDAVRNLELNNVQVLEGRAEDYFNRPACSEKYDRVVFRGFGSLGLCLQIGLPFLTVGGCIILQKDPQEIPQASSGLPPGIRILQTEEVQGFDGHVSIMVVLEKCST